jgi:hypothetical protein
VRHDPAPRAGRLWFRDLGPVALGMRQAIIDSAGGKQPV